MTRWEAVAGRIAGEWRANASLPYRWRPCGNQSGVLGYLVEGEGGGCFVESDAIGGRRAYMKPIRRGYNRAAREKIASDLAYDLEVPVPPAILATREDARSGEERYVCASLVLFPRQFPWLQIKQYASDPTSPVAQAIGNSMPDAAARALAFDTWLAQGDHNDHPHNVVFGYNPRDGASSGSFIFLDYAFSMGCPHGWSDGKFNVCAAVPFSQTMIDYMDKAKLDACIGQIEGYPEDRLAGITGRIPGTHLPAPEAEKIQESLLARRALVRQALAHLL